MDDRIPKRGLGRGTPLKLAGEEENISVSASAHRRLAFQEDRTIRFFW